MIYKCKKCGRKEGFGILPGVTCGLLLMVHLSIGTILAQFAFRWLLHLVPGLRELGWWTFIVFIPVNILLTIASAFAFGFLCELLEWIAVHLFRCPHCRARKWSWGFTQGFGL